MEKKKFDIKEFFRRIMVSLKKRPHNIPLILIVVTYIIYSFNFEDISYTTALIGKSPMGLCTFIVMLFSLLAFVSFLRAFPARQKPKTSMVIVFYVIQAFVLTFAIIYIVILENTLTIEPEYLSRKGAEEIVHAESVLFVHAIMMVVSTIFVALIPVLQKLFNKVNTSTKVDEGENISIDINND